VEPDASWPTPPANVTTLLAGPYTFYAGGYFTNIGSANRNGFAELDAITGGATDWNPSPAARCWRRR